MIKEIEHINACIVKSLAEAKKSAKAKLYGLAESVAVRGDEDTTIPAIILPDGECLNVYSEADKHDVTLYHRLGNISFSDNQNASFGSAKGYDESADMTLLVYGKRAKISPYRMEQLARKVIAETENCTLVGSDFNSLQVFANEYMGVTYFLTPAYFLFKINYRITSTYNARCANIE